MTETKLQGLYEVVLPTDNASTSAIVFTLNKLTLRNSDRSVEIRDHETRCTFADALNETDFFLWDINVSSNNLHVMENADSTSQAGILVKEESCLHTIT